MHFSGVKFGAAICYGWRFPETFSAMASDIETFVVIANWTKKRIDLWYSLLKAIVIENQCYAIGVNHTGVDGDGFEYDRSSVIFVPLSVELNSIASCSDMEIYDLDRILVKKSREEFPAIADKRYPL